MGVLDRLAAARADRAATLDAVRAEAHLLRPGMYVMAGPRLWRHWRVPAPAHLRRTKGWGATSRPPAATARRPDGRAHAALRRLLLPSVFVVPAARPGATRDGAARFPLAVVAAGRRVVLLDPHGGRAARRYEPGYLTAEQVELRRRFAAHLGGPAFEVHEDGTLLLEDFVTGRHVADLAAEERLDVARQLLGGYARLVAAEGGGDASAAVERVLADVDPADLPPQVAGPLASLDLRRAARTWPLVPTATDATAKNLVVTAAGVPVPIDLGRLRRDPFFLYPVGILGDARPDVLRAFLTGELDAEVRGMLDAAGVAWPLDADGRAALLAVRLLLESHREATVTGVYDRARFVSALERRGRPLWDASETIPA